MLQLLTEATVEKITHLGLGAIHIICALHIPLWALVQLVPLSLQCCHFHWGYLFIEAKANLPNILFSGFLDCGTGANFVKPWQHSQQILLYDHDILVVGVALRFLSCCGVLRFPCLLCVGVYNLWCCGSSSQGGIGDAVAAAVSECRDITVKKLAVREVPRSGKPAELLERYGISASCIVKAVNQILSAWLNTQLLLGHQFFRKMFRHFASIYLYR